MPGRRLRVAAGVIATLGLLCACGAAPAAQPGTDPQPGAVRAAPGDEAPTNSVDASDASSAIEDSSQLTWSSAERPEGELPVAEQQNPAASDGRLADGGRLHTFKGLEWADGTPVEAAIINTGRGISLGRGDGFTEPSASAKAIASAEREPRLGTFEPLAVVGNTTYGALSDPRWRNLIPGDSFAGFLPGRVGMLQGDRIRVLADTSKQIKSKTPRAITSLAATKRGVVWTEAVTTVVAQDDEDDSTHQDPSDEGEWIFALPAGTDQPVLLKHLSADEARGNPYAVLGGSMVQSTQLGIADDSVAWIDSSDRLEIHPLTGGPPRRVGTDSSAVIGPVATGGPRWVVANTPGATQKSDPERQLRDGDGNSALVNGYDGGNEVSYLDAAGKWTALLRATQDATLVPRGARGNLVVLDIGGRILIVDTAQRKAWAEGTRSRFPQGVGAAHVCGDAVVWSADNGLGGVQLSVFDTASQRVSNVNGDWSAPLVNGCDGRLVGVGDAYGEGGGLIALAD